MLVWISDYAKTQKKKECKRKGEGKDKQYNTFISFLPQVPCLVYATFNNRIYLYHDITLPHIVTRTIVEVLKKEPKYHQLLEKLNISAQDTAKLKELNHFLLYGRLQ